MKNTITGAFIFIAASLSAQDYTVKIVEDYNKATSDLFNKADEFQNNTIENGMYTSKAANMHAQIDFPHSLYDRQQSCVKNSDMEYTIVKVKGDEESFICVQIDPNGDKAFPYLVFQYNELGDWKLTNYLQDKTYANGKAKINSGATANVIKIEHRYSTVRYFINGELATELKSDNTLEIRWYNNKIYSKNKKFILGLDNLLLGGCAYDKAADEKKEADRKEEEKKKMLSETFMLYRNYEFQSKKYGFQDFEGKYIVPAIYDEVSTGDYSLCFSEGLAKVKRNNKWGFIDKTGQEVVELKYDYVSNFENGYAVVTLGVHPNSKYRLINKTGKEVFAPVGKYGFDIASISEGMILISNNELFGFADTNGVEIISAKYTEAEKFSEGLAAVSLNGKWGFIDKTGREVIPFKYDGVSYFSEGFCAVNIGGKWGFIDKTGKPITESIYYHVESFSDGLAKVLLKEGQASQFIDATGKTAFASRYTSKTSFSEGLALVYLDGEEFETFAGVIDITGNEVIPLRSDFSFAHEGFSNGLVGVKKDMKYGFMDKTGTITIPCKYEEVKEFNNGIALVKLNNKWFYIDKSGKELR